VGLAYFAQTFLDQQKGDGLHLSAEWLYISSESQRLGIACLIFLVAAWLWTFTTSDRENIFAEEQNLKQTTIETSSIQTRKTYKQMAGSSIQIVGIFCTVSAMYFYAVRGENSLVRWLWIGGLGFFLVSLFVKTRLIQWS